MLPPPSALGLPFLAITYRNGPGGPRGPDGLYHLGASEWEDLDAAVRYALRRGSRRVLLAGCSMAGAVVAEFLRRSDRAEAVQGVVLDAPVLDWDATVRFGAWQRGVLPALLAPLAEGVVRLRTGFRWDDSGQRAWRRQFRTAAAILLFHGTADRTVPLAASEAFAEVLGEQVRLVRTPGAGHVQSWNFDPQGYETELRTWLTRVVRDPT